MPIDISRENVTSISSEVIDGLKSALAAGSGELSKRKSDRKDLLATFQRQLKAKGDLVQASSATDDGENKKILEELQIMFDSGQEVRESRKSTPAKELI